MIDGISEENMGYMKDLEEKAKDLVGRYVCDKCEPDEIEDVYFVAGYYVSEPVCDVILVAYHLSRMGGEDLINYTSIYVSEFMDYYEVYPSEKGKAVYMHLRDRMDRMFLGPEVRE